MGHTKLSGEREDHPGRWWVACPLCAPLVAAHDWPTFLDLAEATFRRVTACPENREFGAQVLRSELGGFLLALERALTGQRRHARHGGP